MSILNLQGCKINLSKNINKNLIIKIILIEEIMNQIYFFDVDFHNILE